MHRYHDCYWSWADGKLTVGNDRIERSWIARDGRWIAGALIDKCRDAHAWTEADEAAPAFALPAGRLTDAIDCRAAAENDEGIGRDHLAVYAESAGESAAVRLVVRIYPGEPLLRQTVELKRISSGSREREDGPSDASGGERRASGMRIDDNNTESYSYPEQYVDLFPLTDRHVKWSCTAFLDRTDSNNNLVRTCSGLLYPNEKRTLRGNVMLLRQTLSPRGLLVVKESPTEYGQLADLGFDYQWLGPKLFVAGGGIRADELPDDDYIAAYGTAVGVFDGSEEDGLRVLHRYHRCLRRYEPDRDFMIMSNTWGDRNKDGRIQEEFMLREIRAAGRLGVTHVQIDDGWQQGATKNSVVPGGKWGSYYEEGETFWNVHPERFPRGLAPIVEAAAEAGVKVGLWFSPDSTADFARWEQDADAMLALYRAYGIRCFKLDGIHLRSKLGERNLLRMLRKAVRESGGEIVFNLDTTAEVRLGYFGSTQYGNLFLENRYTDWGNYYPHWTLRNLWQLSKYVPAQKLQMEFLNVERNKQAYEGDPLAPAACGQLYAWAVAMFANPLAWMELSELPNEARQSLAAAIARYREHQADLLSGMVLPIGMEPDGAAWTGLQSMTGEGEGYLLIIRERAADPAYPMRLWGLPAAGSRRLRLRTILKQDGAGRLDTAEEIRDCSVTDASCEVRFAFAHPFSFGLYKYETIESESGSASGRH